jgi:DNA-binding NarL/FixJ family response regulator
VEEGSECSDVTAPSITVVIVDDHDTVGLGLQALIEREPDIEVVSIVGTCAAALEAARRRRPDVMLIDYRLPDGTGAEITHQIRALDDPPAVVMITADADRRVLAQALDAGCAGFVSKHADRDDILAAIRAAAADDSYFTRDVLKHLAHLRRFDQIDDVELGDREIEVLQLTADGFSPDEIAGMLFLSPHTVKNHLRHAMSKLHAHTKLDAVVKAVRARLISIDH